MTETKLLEVGDRVYFYWGQRISVLTVKRVTRTQAVCDDRTETRLKRKRYKDGAVLPVTKPRYLWDRPKYLIESTQTKQDLEKTREHIKHLQLVEKAKGIKFSELGQAKLKQILNIAGVKQ